jgi:phospholipid/cholesterol/gamma-HCH transport system ATP-binding protein
MAVPAVELIDVHTTLDGHRVLRGVSFAAPEGEITVLLGPSGVGKTTCIRHITGLLFPDEGDVLIEGVSRRQMRKAEHNALAHRFGVLLQGSGLYGSALWGSMTVVQNLMFQLQALTDTPEDELRDRALERLREVGLADHADMLPANLSAGMSKRVALARALVSDPDFVVLDSFDQGVDPVRLGKLCDLIRWHHENQGGTYIVTTHDMDVARRLADHAVVLYAGRVVEEGPADQIFGSERAEVRQFVTGDVAGPLSLEGDPGGAQRSRPGAPGETGMHIPIPLAVGATLVITTASVLAVGRTHPVEIGALVLTWVVAAVLLAVRYERSR